MCLVKCRRKNSKHNLTSKTTAKPTKQQQQEQKTTTTRTTTNNNKNNNNTNNTPTTRDNQQQKQNKHINAHLKKLLPGKSQRKRTEKHSVTLAIMGMESSICTECASRLLTFQMFIYSMPPLQLRVNYCPQFLKTPTNS